MATFRIPYPKEPERRRAAFEKASAKMASHGTLEGTPESGTFHGSTPIGGFAGAYHYLEGTGELEIKLTKKPWLVSTARIESELRKRIAQA